MTLYRAFKPIMLIFFAFSSVINAEENSKVELQQRLVNLQSFSANFEQTIFDNTEVLDSTRGKLSLKRPNMMRWQTFTPEETLLIADGTSIWNIDSFVEQVTVFSQDETLTNNPMLLLTNPNPDVWDKFSIIRLQNISSAKSNERTVYEISSRDENAQITQLTLTFERNELVALSTVDAQNQRSNLVFSDIAMNALLASEVFTPVYPDNYSVDDQR